MKVRRSDIAANSEPGNRNWRSCDRAPGRARSQLHPRFPLFPVSDSRYVRLTASILPQTHPRRAGRSRSSVPTRSRRSSRAEHVARGRPARPLADDEAYWRRSSALSTPTGTLINLNNGGVVPTPTHVLEADDPRPAVLERAAGGAHVARARAADRVGAQGSRAVISAAIPRRWRSRATPPRPTRR